MNPEMRGGDALEDRTEDRTEDRMALWMHREDALLAFACELPDSPALIFHSDLN